MEQDSLQSDVDDRIRQKIGGYWGRFDILARLTEELGELAAALQREEGLRPRKSDVSLEAELGDVLFTLAAFANVTGTRLEDAVLGVMRKYDDRDATAWQEAMNE